MANTQALLRDELTEAVRDAEEVVERQHRRFHARFQESYRSLATLSKRAHTAGRVLAVRAAKAFDAADAADTLVGQLQAGGRATGWKTLGGAGVGAVVGSMVLPGVGTAIGAMVGGVAGWMFRPSLVELRNKCWEELQPAVARGFDQFADQARQAFTTAAEGMHDHLAGSIGAYAARYKRVIDEVIAADEAEAGELMAYRLDLDDDQADIQARRDRQAETRARLRAG